MSLRKELLLQLKILECDEVGLVLSSLDRSFFMAVMNNRMAILTTVIILMHALQT